MHVDNRELFLSTLIILQEKKDFKQNNQWFEEYWEKKDNTT
jgi:hypothetical protein